MNLVILRPGIQILDLPSGGFFALISKLRSGFQDSSVQWPNFKENYLEKNTRFFKGGVTLSVG